METSMQTIAGKLTTYTIAPISADTVAVSIAEPFSINRVEHKLVRQATFWRSPIHDADGATTGYHLRAGKPGHWYLPLDRTDGGIVTEKARDVFLADVEAACLPLWNDAQFVRNGIIAALDLGGIYMRDGAAAIREYAAQLERTAQEWEARAIAYEIRADAMEQNTDDADTLLATVSTADTWDARNTREARAKRLLQVPTFYKYVEVRSIAAAETMLAAKINPVDIFRESDRIA